VQHSWLSKVVSTEPLYKRRRKASKLLPQPALSAAPTQTITHQLRVSKSHGVQAIGAGVLIVVNLVEAVQRGKGQVPALVALGVVSSQHGFCDLERQVSQLRLRYT
jgi:hypothetical protein